MGIRNFGTILKRATSGVSTKSYSDFSGETWAIDASIFCYRFAHNAQAKRPNSHIDGFYQLFLRLLKFKIKPILIFDGRAPQEKQYTVDARIKHKLKNQEKVDKIRQELTDLVGDVVVETPQQVTYLLSQVKGSETEASVTTKVNELIKAKKNIITFQPSMYDDIRMLCEIMDVPFLRAQGEADALCAKLYETGQVQAIMSEDSDILLYRGGRLIRKFGWTNEIELIELDKVLASLGINYEQFVDLAILCGTDYTNGTVTGLGPTVAIDAITQGLSIEQIISTNHYHADNFNYQEARDLIRTACHSENTTCVPSFDYTKIQVRQLVNLMSEKCNYRPVTVEKHYHQISDVFYVAPIRPRFKITLKTGAPVTK